jgi:large subunit ribosomal protein L22
MAKGSGVKTNESPARAAKTGQRGPAGVGVRAEANYLRMSAYKVREVLDQIRGQTVADAADILRFCPRDAAIDIAQVLKSAVANAGHNEDIPAEELYVSACYADEGPTIKRFRPRARGRTGRIFKRTAHITVVVSRMPESLLSQARNASAAQAQNRARRTAGSRATAEQAVTSSRREETGVEEVVAGATLAATAAASTVTDTAVADAVVETSSPAMQGFVSETSETADTPEIVTETATASVAPGTPFVSTGNDPLNQIIGIGPKLHEELNAAGINTFAQLAALSDSDITALDAKVSRSADQIIEWRTQAQQILDGTWVDTSTKNS